MSKKLGPTSKHRASTPRRLEKTKGDLQGHHEDLVRAERDATRPDYTPGVARRGVGGRGGVKNRKDHRGNIRIR